MEGIRRTAFETVGVVLIGKSLHLGWFRGVFGERKSMVLPRSRGAGRRGEERKDNVIYAFCLMSTFVGVQELSSRIVTTLSLIAIDCT